MSFNLPLLLFKSELLSAVLTTTEQWTLMIAIRLVRTVSCLELFECFALWVLDIFWFWGIFEDIVREALSIFLICRFILRGFVCLLVTMCSGHLLNGIYAAFFIWDLLSLPSDTGLLSSSIASIQDFPTNQDDQKEWHQRKFPSMIIQ